MNRRWALALLLGVTSVSATACQTMPISRAPWSFGLAAVNNGTPLPIPPATVAVGTSPTAMPTDVQKGTVTIGFGSLLQQPRQRQLMALLTDVDHVLVTLTPASGAALTQSVAKAAIVSGKVAATFSGVAPGAWTFKVEVYDGPGAVLPTHLIGVASGPVTVAAGSTTAVTADVSLFPSLAPVPAAAGGGSPVSPTAGNVVADLTLQNGVVAKPLVLDTSMLAGANPFARLIPDGSGQFWATDVSTGGIRHVDRTGTLLASYQIGTPNWASIVTAPGGQVVAKTGNLPAATNLSTVVRLAANGSLLSTASVPVGDNRLQQPPLAVTTSGEAWVASSTDLIKVAIDGTWTVLPNSARIADLVPDGLGALYSLETPEGLPGLPNAGVPCVAKKAANGMPLWTRSATDLGATPVGFGVDASNNLWVIAKTATIGDVYRLIEYAPNGDLLGNFLVPSGLGVAGTFTQDASQRARVLFGPAGNPLVYFASRINGFSWNSFVVKFGLDGSMMGVYYAPELVPPGLGVSAASGYALECNTDGGLDIVFVATNGGEGSPAGNREYFYTVP